MKVDMRAAEEKLDKLKKLAPKMIKEALPTFVNATPARSGHARNHTRAQDNKIIADYNYAVPLDTKYNMVKQTIDYIRLNLRRVVDLIYK
jgi:hypothetical protein